ncbi:MAG: hypothetical protein IMY69_07310 [Bacteroidetes bacterium]|nr:hypothetical protein [Bacteroidota bacterium]MCK4406862.1 hypothetical protein [Bacteroidales bacterium]
MSFFSLEELVAQDSWARLVDIFVDALPLDQPGFNHIMLKEWDLIGGETIAIDSLKIRAQNSLKNNFNQKKN